MIDGKTMVVVEDSFDEALRKVKEAFDDQGFAVLTEIDVQTTMHDHLGLDMDRYVILVVWNSHLARQALEVDPSNGLLLPCNIVVRQYDDHAVVEALEPTIISRLNQHPGVQPIAEEMDRRIDAVLKGPILGE